MLDSTRTQGYEAPVLVDPRPAFPP